MCVCMLTGLPGVLHLPVSCPGSVVTVAEVVVVVVVVAIIEFVAEDRYKAI